MQQEIGNCLRCGAHIDGHAGVGDEGVDESKRPYAGALSICAYCGNLAAYDEKDDGSLYLRELTKDERADAEADPIIQKVMFATIAANEITREQKLKQRNVRRWFGDGLPKY